MSAKEFSRKDTDAGSTVWMRRRHRPDMESGGVDGVNRHHGNAVAERRFRCDVDATCSKLCCLISVALNRVKLDYRTDGGRVSDCRIIADLTVLVDVITKKTSAVLHVELAGRWNTLCVRQHPNYRIRHQSPGVRTLSRFSAYFALC